LHFPIAESRALVEFAPDAIRHEFGDVDLATAAHYVRPEKYAQLLRDLKPKFVQHPSSKVRVHRILRAFGSDLERTYIDLPRTRTAAIDVGHKSL
jgi:hypothetical protein